VLGIVTFSFALRSDEQEPGPCNVRLGRAAMRIIASTWRPAIVSQWEVSRYLTSAGIVVAVTVQPRPDGTYLSSEDIWSRAKVLFEELGVSEVIPVAQPFLHLRKVRRLMAADGYTVHRRRIGWIGFDRQSAQP
jgi:hypothetical protein